MAAVDGGFVVVSRKDDDMVEVSLVDDVSPASAEEVVVVSVARTETVTKRVAPNGGYGWCVAVASFVITFILTGFFKCAGKFSPFIKAEWPDTSSTVHGWIFGLIGALSLLVSAGTAELVSKFGYRAMVISGGLLCSIGLGLSYFAPVAGYLVWSIGFFLGIGGSFIITSVVGCTGKYFTTRKPAAITLALTGGCIGAMAMPVSVEALLATLGLRYSFLALAALFLVIPLCGLLYGPPEARFITVTEEVEVSEEESAPAISTEPVEEEERAPENVIYRYAKVVAYKLALPLLDDVCFVILCACFFMAQLGNPGFRGYLNGQAAAVGGSPYDISCMMYITGTADLLARLVYGSLSNRSPLSRGLEFGMASLCTGLALIVMGFTSAFWQVAVLTFVSSFASSIMTISTPLVLSANHGATNLTRTLGLVRMFQGFAVILWRPVGALLRTGHGTFVALVTSGVFLNVSALLALVLWKTRNAK